MSPTVTPYANFDVVADVRKLRSAMKDWGTDEKTLIGILTGRSNEQRQAIVKAYHQSFNFVKIMISLLRPPMEFYCMEVHKGITDLHNLPEILCTRNAEEIKLISLMYEQSECIAKSRPEFSYKYIEFSSLSHPKCTTCHWPTT